MPAQTRTFSRAHRVSDDTILREEHTFLKLSQLCGDFVYAAKSYGRLIISEKWLPAARKTIVPSPSDSLGGFAGGEKFECGGIIFKFAVDDRGMYGSDEAAMRAAARDLLGVATLFPFHAIGLRVPLMCVVDHLGFRLIAMTKIPRSQVRVWRCFAYKHVCTCTNLCENVSVDAHLKSYFIFSPSSRTRWSMARPTAGALFSRATPI